ARRDWCCCPQSATGTRKRGLHDDGGAALIAREQQSASAGVFDPRPVMPNAQQLGKSPLTGNEIPARLRSPFPTAEAARRLSRIPLFHGENQQKPLIPALRRLNPTFQVIDLIGSDAGFPYAAKQRIFSALQGN